jgi:Domain of unknown function DUF29/ParB-like nuclease domain
MGTNWEDGRRNDNLKGRPLDVLAHQEVAQERLVDSADAGVPDGSTTQPLAVIRAHPIADSFPRMGDAEFAALVADIKQYGLRTPIAVMDNLILDGRHRYWACTEAGISPRFETYTGDDPVGYVLSANLIRRHLSEGQRGMVASALAMMRQGARTNAQICAMSQAQAAERLAVSRRTVQYARVVREQGLPALVGRVERGEVSVSLGAKVAQMPRAQQASVVGLDQRAMRDAVKAGLGEPEIVLQTPKQRVGDTLQWGEQQAGVLRRLAAGERVHDQVEWLDVAEAIEAPGKDLRRQLASRISNVLSCLIQLDLATREDRGQRVWRDTIDREVGVIEQLLADTPSLRAAIPAVISAKLADAKAAALKTLHARKPTFFRLDGGFLKPLQKPRATRFEDPDEVEKSVSWAAHEVEFWMSTLCEDIGRRAER